MNKCLWHATQTQNILTVINICKLHPRNDSVVAQWQQDVSDNMVGIPAPRVQVQVNTESTSPCPEVILRSVLLRTHSAHRVQQLVTRCFGGGRSLSLFDLGSNCAPEPWDHHGSLWLCRSFTMFYNTDDLQPTAFTKGSWACAVMCFTKWWTSPHPCLSTTKPFEDALFIPVKILSLVTNMFQTGVQGFNNFLNLFEMWCWHSFQNEHMFTENGVAESLICIWIDILDKTFLTFQSISIVSNVFFQIHL